MAWVRSSRSKKEHEARDFIASLAGRALAILDPMGRNSFLEGAIGDFLDCRRVEIILRPEGPERFSTSSTQVRNVISRVLAILEGLRQPFLSPNIARRFGVGAILKTLDATYAIPIKSAESRLGLLVLDTSPRDRLNRGQEESLESLSGQVAIVAANSELLRGKIELERRLSQQAHLVQLGEMTARIAHEIKNPLSSIKTIVQVMREDAAIAGHYSRDLDLVNGELDRLAASVVQLLDFARPAAEAREPVRLRDVVEATLHFLERDITQLNAQVRNEVPADLPAVRGNQALFREVLLNLFLNAFQAGGSGVCIIARARRDSLEDGTESWVRLEIEDDGPGISPEVRAKIFTPFFTTKQRGTGLGLAIVQRHVESLEGSIEATSPVRAGRGTRFLINIPLFPKEETP